MANVSVVNYFVPECQQNPIIEHIDLSVKTDLGENIIISLDAIEEQEKYYFEREHNDPKDLISKLVFIDDYKVTKSSQSPIIEQLYGYVELKYKNNKINKIEFDFEDLII